MNEGMRSVNAGANRSFRYVVATRKTLFTLLLEQHGTLGQAEFYLRSRGQAIGDYIAAHERFEAAVMAVEGALPREARRARVDREQLDRFLFEPSDVVMVVGQDGLVPNVAKYLSGQPVIGVNPDPERYDGVLCRLAPAAVRAVIEWAGEPDDRLYTFEPRTMAVAEREDGQRLLALNEVFIGHRSHQSARYRIALGGNDDEERQSSSGVICATGTGATGWARSINEGLADAVRLPRPADRAICWFVREPFPSVATGTNNRAGVLDAEEAVTLTSEMPEGGVIFADGLEADRLEFLSGQRATVRVAPGVLNLVVPVGSAPLARSTSRRPVRAAAPGNVGFSSGRTVSPATRRERGRAAGPS